MSNYALEIENLYFSYENENILEDLSMKIENGKFALIIGENGAGKTTLIRLILNQLKKIREVLRFFLILSKNLITTKIWLIFFKLP